METHIVGFFFLCKVYNDSMKDTTSIDLVIPYVNNKDMVWRNTYIDYCKKHNLNERIIDMLGVRYNGMTFIYKQIKLVNKNMPWINKIFLLLSNIEQVDKSKLPPNVEIVLHRQFIPQAFLPTFNSTTIEMFLWNIPNLGEKFIYGNDDMLPLGKLKKTDFFINGKIRIKWKRAVFNFNTSQFGYHCNNNCVVVYGKLHIPYDYISLRPMHSYTPMIKSHCAEAFNLVKDKVLPHIKAFRTQYQCNQYIYSVYEYCVYGTEESNIDFYYTNLDKEFELNHQVVCVNGEKNAEIVRKFKEELNKLCE